MVFQKNKLQEYLNIISKLKLKDSFGVALEGATLQLNGNIRLTIKGNLAFVVREDKKSRDSEYIIICPHINKETGRIINTFFIQYFVSTPEKSLSDRLIFPERTLDSSFKIFIESYNGEQIKAIQIITSNSSHLLFVLRTNIRFWYLINFGDHLDLLICNDDISSEILNASNLESEEIEIIDL